MSDHSKTLNHNIAGYVFTLDIDFSFYVSTQEIKIVGLSVAEIMMPNGEPLDFLAFGHCDNNLQQFMNELAFDDIEYDSDVQFELSDTARREL